MESLKHNAGIIGKISSIIEETSVLLGNSATTNTKSRANLHECLEFQIQVAKH